MSDHDLMETPRAKFGDIVENGWASENNPTRVGFFVREGRRPPGRMNPGRYWQITDGKGKFWELSPVGDHRITVRRADALIPPGFVVAPREVVEPFYSWAKDNVAAEEDGGYIWSGLGCQNERIRVWFGPSEFGRLAEVFAALPPPGGGKDSSSTHPAARIASDHAATAPHSQSEGETR